MNKFSGVPVGTEGWNLTDTLTVVVVKNLCYGIGYILFVKKFVKNMILLQIHILK